MTGLPSCRQYKSTCTLLQGFISDGHGTDFTLAGYLLWFAHFWSFRPTPQFARLWQASTPHHRAVFFILSTPWCSSCDKIAACPPTHNRYGKKNGHAGASWCGPCFNLSDDFIPIGCILITPEKRSAKLTRRTEILPLGIGRFSSPPAYFLAHTIY